MAEFVILPREQIPAENLARRRRGNRQVAHRHSGGSVAWGASWKNEGRASVEEVSLVSFSSSARPSLVISSLLSSLCLQLLADFSSSLLTYDELLHSLVATKHLLTGLSHRLVAVVLTVHQPRGKVDCGMTVQCTRA